MARIQHPVDLFAGGTDTASRRLTCDDWGNLNTVTNGHYQIHAGNAYMVGYVWNEGAEIADDATAQVLIQPSAGMHLIFGVASGGDAEIRFYKGTTFSAAGTALSTFNKNEFSSNTSGATITHTPTVTDAGTSFPPQFIFGGTGGNAFGVSDGSYDSEIVLSPTTDYLVSVTNRSGVAQVIAISLEWYEPGAQL